MSASQDDLVAQVLGEVVPIGSTAQEQELGAAVARHVSGWRPQPIADPDVAAELASMADACPTCGRPYDKEAP